MSSWTLTEISASDDAATIATAVAAVERVSVAHELSVRGYDDLADTAEEMTAWLHNQAYSTRTLVLALPAPGAPLTEAVGHLQLLLPQQDNTHVAHVAPTVDPAHTRRGVGTALVAEAERRARAQGRTSLIAWTMQAGEPAEGEPSLAAPTGSGAVNPQDPAVHFALAHGYRLEQAERHSLLRLPVAPDLVASLHADAAAHAGPEYRLHTWHGLPPEDRHEALAVLYTRMSTDAPMADLDLTEQAWDADRVRYSFEQAAAAGYEMVTVAAEHLPTGALAAFTQVEAITKIPSLGFQGDTLVLREHRGRRLGMLIKTAMLARLAENRPALRRVHTWNASENSHMLDINVALGFAPESVTGSWQRRLA